MKRQVSEVEKLELIARHTRDGKLRCFIDDAPIEDVINGVEFHHIAPFSERNPTNLDNVAPVCKEHHHRIRTLSLSEFKDKLELENFFAKNQRADGVRLDKVLNEKLGSAGHGKPVKTEMLDGSIRIYWEGKTTETLPVYRCPVTQIAYFHALVPLEHLSNDPDLQPRPLDQKRVWELYHHFLMYTQLAPAVCRLVSGKILLFDGQHKTAAQVWAGRRVAECKIYIDPDARTMKETVLAAHDKLRQLPFYTSTLLAKYSDLFKEDWEEYVETGNLQTEEGFVLFLIKNKNLSKGEALKRLRSAIENDILEDQDNRLCEFISERNKTRKNPLTIHLIQRSFFSDFIAPVPMSVEFESPEDFRRAEKRNLIRLFNMITGIALTGRWNPDAENSDHKMAERIFAAGSVRAWSSILKSSIASSLAIHDDEEREKVFYREIAENEFDQRILPLVQRLFSHKIWKDADQSIDDLLRVNNVDSVKGTLKSKGLTAGWLMGLTE